MISIKKHKSITFITTTAALILWSVAAAQPHDHDGHDHDKPTTNASTNAGGKDEHGHERGDKSHGDEHTDEVKLTADAISRYGIKVAPVALQKLAATITVPARVSFNTDAMAHVGSAVKGRATEIKVRVGDHVKHGDELVIVESPELGEAQSDFLQRRTAVDVATSAITPAKSAAERARKLHEQSQGIALGEVQKREADVKAAEGALQTAQAAVTAAENKLHLLGFDQHAVEALLASSEINPRYVIRAPIDGQVVDREITLGELVSPEKEALMVLANVSTVWVIADVPESRLREVVQGTEARVLITAASDERLVGKVAMIAPTLDPSTRTAQIRVVVPNSEGNLRPGMFATAEIVSSTSGGSDAVIAVPEEAVQTVEGGPAIFVPVEGEENTFAKRAVTVGPTVGSMRPVTSGLKEGERVVVSGTFILKAELGKGEAAHEH